MSHIRSVEEAIIHVCTKKYDNLAQDDYCGPLPPDRVRVELHTFGGGGCLVSSWDQYGKLLQIQYTVSDEHPGYLLWNADRVLWWEHRDL